MTNLATFKFYTLIAPLLFCSLVASASNEVTCSIQRVERPAEKVSFSFNPNKLADNVEYNRYPTKGLSFIETDGLFFLVFAKLRVSGKKLFITSYFRESLVFEDIFKTNSASIDLAQIRTGTKFFYDQPLYEGKVYFDFYCVMPPL